MKKNVLIVCVLILALMSAINICYAEEEVIIIGDDPAQLLKESDVFSADLDLDVNEFVEMFESSLEQYELKFTEKTTYQLDDQMLRTLVSVNNTVFLYYDANTQKIQRIMFTAQWVSQGVDTNSINHIVNALIDCVMQMQYDADDDQRTNLKMLVAVGNAGRVCFFEDTGFLMTYQAENDEEQLKPQDSMILEIEPRSAMEE